MTTYTYRVIVSGRPGEATEAAAQHGVELSEVTRTEDDNSVAVATSTIKAFGKWEDAHWYRPAVSTLPGRLLWHGVLAPTEQYEQPMPGDAVRLAAPWRWVEPLVKVGSIGVIGGVVGQDHESRHASIEFHYSTYRSDEVVSSSGGPATIATDLAELRPTGKTMVLKVWRLRDGSRIGAESVHYEVRVPVWEWRPTD